MNLQSLVASLTCLSSTLQQAYKHFQRALSLWPKDNLRPEVQFSEFVARGLDTRLARAPAVDELKELKQANALYALADDRFKRQVRPTPRHGSRNQRQCANPV